ncbi:MAG: Two-component system sensor histidine kinase [uncultured Acidimicrobiales bacterium]|uniref:histidine kinase n=1 Tax=uncultured Acidimicrobiales bacterium TaxID=310071 RepID=A0A6J4JIM1_9ACTN|nr:MAG: Two-component system sensor histidine kinase [uncultured Acidimicrobiales bacterium]
MITGNGVAASGVTPHLADAGMPIDREQPAPGGRRSTVVAYGLGLICALLVAGGFLLGVYMPNLHNGLIAAAFTAVGVFVVLRRPGHREGRLFIATGMAHAVMFFGRQYGLYAGSHHGDTLPAVSWVTWMGVWPLALVLVLSGVTIMCFPDGRLPLPRWRPVVATMVAAGALLALGSALWPVEYARNSLSVPHPLQVGGYDTAGPLWPSLTKTVYPLFQIAWAACVVVRLRRARGDEAQQLKWFVYAVAMGAVAMVSSLVLLGSPALGVLVVPLVPVAAGVAIVKYRLYDIDLVINKTLVVGAMAGLITATYVALVVGAGGLLGFSASPNLMLSLVATAMVAVAFEPARRRVQRWADRLVYGHRPTPYEALARLSTQLSLDGQRADLLAGLASTFADGVGAAEATLWVGSEAELVAVASWPPHVGPDAPRTAAAGLASLEQGGRAHVRPIVHQGALRGAVTLTKEPGEALTGAEDRLLGDLVAQAGLVIDNVGLAAELQHRLNQISAQAVELRAAAKRIVAAQDDARRRIERDLHDGAQQRLVTLALSLQAVSERAASGGDEGLALKVDDARGQLTEALAELREMARGIHPAMLTEEGLDAALGFLAERSPLPVQLEVDLGRRLPQEVEATAYFIVSEALTNAAKHSGAPRVVVGARVDGGRLSIEVSDNGRGGADGRRGSGLQGLADRLATLNGRLTVDSPVEGGTRLRAEIPCG